VVVVSNVPMKKHILATAALFLSSALICAAAPVEAAKGKVVMTVAAQPATVPEVFPAPGEIVAAAPASDWMTIAPSDLLVMDLAPDSKGHPRRVVIQLMPAPFSQGWIGNIRKLAVAHWWDGTAVVRVQDNYVTQWGDPDGDVPGKAKKLPDGLVSMPESAYVQTSEVILDNLVDWYKKSKATGIAADLKRSTKNDENNSLGSMYNPSGYPDPYSILSGFYVGWQLGSNGSLTWPTHCYGMVGVGRNLSPDTGTGAELYTVIGHAPRHLDRNIALVGRIIEGMENMSSLPRGTGDLGFYKTPEERTAIPSVRLMSEMGNDKPLPTYEYLNTESASFAKYADARANRRDPFFIKPAGGADICNIPVPVRRRK
jgi:cyclophilin family peptidyl-prolyl cis-trans isomerase